VRYGGRGVPPYKACMKERIFQKFTSARFIFVMTCALVFIYVSFRGLFPKEDIKEIIMVVLMAYFSRADRVPPKEKA